MKRVIVIVLDGVGAGEAPDAADYGDVGSNSLGNVARVIGGLKTPNMYELGLGNITDIQGVPRNPNAKATSACRMVPVNMSPSQSITLAMTAENSSVGRVNDGALQENFKWINSR